MSTFKKACRVYSEALKRDWFVIVSIPFTVGPLIVSLAPELLPPELSSVPRWVFILWTFAVFVFANFKVVYTLVKPDLAVSVLGIERIQVDHLYLEEVPPLFGHVFDLILPANVHLVNGDRETSAEFALSGVQPDVCDVAHTRPALSRKSGEKVTANSLHVKPGEIVNDLVVTSKVSPFIERIESQLGSLSQFRTITLTYSIASAHSPPCLLDVQFDLAELHRHIEREIERGGHGEHFNPVRTLKQYAGMSMEWPPPG